MSSKKESEIGFEGFETSSNYECDENSLEGFKIESPTKIKEESLNTIIENPFALKESELKIKIEPFGIKEEFINEPLKIKKEIEIKNEPLFDEDFDSSNKEQFLGFQISEFRLESTFIEEQEVAYKADERKIQEDNIDVNKLVKNEEQLNFYKLRESKFPIVHIRKLTKSELRKYIIEEDSIKNENINKHNTDNSLSNLTHAKSLRQNEEGKNNGNIIPDELNNVNMKSSLKAKNNVNGKIYSHKTNLITTKKQHPLIHSKRNLKNSNLEINSKNLINFSKIMLFKCSECRFACKRKGILKMHLLTHVDTKLFKCSECKYECNYKSSLKRHLLVHSNIKEERKKEREKA